MLEKKYHLNLIRLIKSDFTFMNNQADKCTSFEINDVKLFIIIIQRNNKPSS